MIVVTNPMDVMAFVAMKATGFPGSASSAWRRARLGPIPDVHRHGTKGVGREHPRIRARRARDTMVPLPRFSTVAGIPITELLSTDRINKLVERTRNGGAEIVSLLKTGSAYYAPSAAALEMVEAILLDKKKILPCSALLEGEYGVKSVFAGIPVKLGAKGIEQFVEVKLNAEERAGS